MSLSDQAPASSPDELTPATLRRLHLWRALTDLSKAQADGRLSADQMRLLDTLADNLQQLASRLSQLADLGRQYTQALEPLLDGPASQSGGQAAPSTPEDSAQARLVLPPISDAASPRPPVER